MSNICFGLLNYNPMIKLLVWCCDSLWMGRMYGRQSGCHCLSMNSYWFRFCWCLIDLGSQHQQTLMVPKKPAAKYLLCVEQLEFNHHAAVSMLCFIVDGCMYGGQSGHQGLGMSRSTTCLAYVCNRWSSACGCFSVEQRHEVINELSWLLLVFHIMPLAGFHARLWVAASMAAIRSAMLSMLWSLGHQAAFVFFWSPCLGLKVEADFLHSVGVGVYLCFMWLGACMASSQVNNACFWAFALLIQDGWWSSACEGCFAFEQKHEAMHEVGWDGWMDGCKQAIRWSLLLISFVIVKLCACGEGFLALGTQSQSKKQL